MWVIAYCDPRSPRTSSAWRRDAVHVPVLECQLVPRSLFVLAGVARGHGNTGSRPSARSATRSPYERRPHLVLALPIMPRSWPTVGVRSRSGDLPSHHLSHHFSLPHASACRRWTDARCRRLRA